MTGKPAGPSDLTRKVWSDLRVMLDNPPSQSELTKTLRHLAKWRAGLLANTHLDRAGSTITTGPFSGMIYDLGATEGGALPRLLGIYEAALHPVIDDIIAMTPPRIIDIGCAEGYYAVGLARALPDTTIHAHDTDPRAQTRCAELAARNGVADRVQVGSALDHAALDALIAPGSVIICDIEGAEDGLLDPSAVPALKEAHILVEVHDCFHPGLSARLADRFRASHAVTRLDRHIAQTALPAWMDGLSDLDRVLALWEWRAGDTPWLWLTPHS